MATNVLGLLNQFKALENDIKARADTIGREEVKLHEQKEQLQKVHSEIASTSESVSQSNREIDRLLVQKDLWLLKKDILDKSLAEQQQERQQMEAELAEATDKQRSQLDRGSQGLVHYSQQYQLANLMQAVRETRYREAQQARDQQAAIDREQDAIKAVKDKFNKRRELQETVSELEGGCKETADQLVAAKSEFKEVLRNVERLKVERRELKAGRKHREDMLLLRNQLRDAEVKAAERRKGQQDSEADTETEFDSEVMSVDEENIAPKFSFKPVQPTSPTGFQTLSVMLSDDAKEEITPSGDGDGYKEEKKKKKSAFQFRPMAFSKNARL